MLDPWIIEKIRRREEERAREQERNYAELPVDAPRHQEADKSKQDDSNRGVVVIDI
jgi:hypothetical protein